MGYKSTRKQYKLKFIDPEMEGLEVITHGTDFNAFMDMASLAEGGAVDASKFTPSDIERMYTNFAKSLISWNLEDEDSNPIPCTKAGLYSQDIDFVVAVMRAWSEAVATVSTPLQKPSSSGAPALEGSLPMETSSSSQ